MINFNSGCHVTVADVFHVPDELLWHQLRWRFILFYCKCSILERSFMIHWAEGKLHVHWKRVPKRSDNKWAFCSQQNNQQSKKTIWKKKKRQQTNQKKPQTNKTNNNKKCNRFFLNQQVQLSATVSYSWGNLLHILTSPFIRPSPSLYFLNFFFLTVPLRCWFTASFSQGYKSSSNLQCNFQAKLHTFVLVLILSFSFNGPSLSLVFFPRQTSREQSSTLLSYVFLS